MINRSLPFGKGEKGERESGATTSVNAGSLYE